jgi:hypothetical protein
VSSEPHGIVHSGVEVANVSGRGIWLLAEGRARARESGR